MEAKQPKPNQAVKIEPNGRNRFSFLVWVDEEVMCKIPDVPGVAAILPTEGTNQYMVLIDHRFHPEEVKQAMSAELEAAAGGGA